MLALRADELVLAAALNETVPFPLPCPEVIVSHEPSLLDAVHGHPPWVVTWNEPEFVLELKDAFGALSP
jgi:hypothetical protein